MFIRMSAVDIKSGKCSSGLQLGEHGYFKDLETKISRNSFIVLCMYVLQCIMDGYSQDKY